MLVLFERIDVSTDKMETSATADVPTGVTLVRDFVNTIDYDEHTDVLRTTDELTTFLHETGLLVRRAPSTEEDLALARRLRTGLREALELNHDAATRALPDLDAVLAGLPMRLHWADGAPALVPAAAGVPGALAQVAVAVTDAVAADTWTRLKICSDDGCAWAYYDTSKNRSKNWCGTSCGNKAKTRAYRARKQSSLG
jgi:predicted RNA-binding Zn ribbon-like protein